MTKRAKKAKAAHWNMFRDRTTGKLDRRGLRVSAVYRLFMQKHLIGRERAIELLAQRKVEHATHLVELWVKWPAQKWATP